MCCVLKRQFEKKKHTHAQTDLCHSQKGELPACPEASAGKDPLEIMEAVCVRATQFCSFQFSVLLQGYVNPLYYV